jgi:hypothetical protein
MGDQNRKSASCPVEKCDGAITVPADLPNGIYDCVCRHAKLRLSWATYANFERRPMLSLADDTDRM